MALREDGMTERIPAATPSPDDHPLVSFFFPDDDNAHPMPHNAVTGSLLWTIERYRINVRAKEAL